MKGAISLAAVFGLLTVTAGAASAGADLACAKPPQIVLFTLRPQVTAGRGDAGHTGATFVLRFRAYGRPWTFRVRDSNHGTIQEASQEGATDLITRQGVFRSPPPIAGEKLSAEVIVATACGSSTAAASTFVPVPPPVLVRDGGG